MTTQEQLAILNAKLQASLMGGSGLKDRIAAIRRAIADLQAQSTSSSQ